MRSLLLMCFELCFVLLKSLDK